MRENRDITRAIIEATVERSLREVDEDPQRSIRKLIDLAKQFSNGRFISEIYSIFQDLLRNEDSPYYSAIEHILHYTSRKALKHFGVNIGYNSFTRGGKMIRSLEENSSYMIPWSLGIELDPSKENQLSVSQMDNIIKQGLELGIFTYSISLQKRIGALSDYFPLFKGHPGCAFFLFLCDEELDNETAEQLAGCTNVLTFLKASGEYIDTNALLLRRRKAWYGAYEYYNDQTAGKVLSSSSYRKYLASEGSFVMTIAEKGTSIDCIIETQKVIKETRLAPSQPLFVFDKYGDTLQLKTILSSGQCFFEITDDHIIHTNRGDYELGEDALNLKELFTKYLQK